MRNSRHRHNRDLIPAPTPRPSWAAAGSTRPPRGQAAVAALAPGKSGAVGGAREAVAGSCQDSDDALASKGLDLLGQHLELRVAVAQLAMPPASKGLDLLGQQLALLVAVAQPAIGSTTPAPDGAIGGEGEVVVASSRHSEDALASKGLDFLGQQLVLRVAVAQLACASPAPAPEAAVGGEGEAVVGSPRHNDDAPPSQRLDLLGQQLVL
eukprot:CAMPEP_0202802434 /NCGR_PEP_ID=MMETSP1388-20130828/102636_1 /ASSEMBLY_ACC=CAM_ASM_000864 /TAXON_ID=37098 /ORGANISM="Isochrysis sp, Strain CCMP1244" /LENGTH=209 /DNA_ID=CAMNT_0049472425 /DNA_START=165 /DNA_END=793 /DNA_ORIENTATION=-